MHLKQPFLTYYNVRFFFIRIKVKYTPFDIIFNREKLFYCAYINSNILKLKKKVGDDIPDCLKL